MNPYKRYSLLLLLVLLLFLGFHGLTWKLVTEDILTNNNYDGGDQVRLGYVPESRLPRRISFDLPRRHTSFKEYRGEPVDVVTIGDSFSNVCGMGRNYYYQDYLATLSGVSVLNIGIFKVDPKDTFVLNPFETLVILTNAGLLEKIRPRYVILESAVRYSIARIADFTDLGSTADPALVADPGHYVTYNGRVPDMSFINDGNMKYYWYRFRYRFTDHPSGWITVKELSRPLFSVRNERHLLFFTDDADSIARVTPDAVRRLNANLNEMARRLRRLGIELCFMPAVDKYDLYSRFIVANNLPENRFFDELRPLAKEYRFIDTKGILLPALERGERDIFYPDDSHWSWKASQLIFENVRFGGGAATGLPEERARR